MSNRLNGDGDRQANAALHRVVSVRLRYEQQTKDRMRRRIGQGMTNAEVIRCLKRCVLARCLLFLAKPARTPWESGVTPIGASGSLPHLHHKREAGEV